MAVYLASGRKQGPREHAWKRGLLDLCTLGLEDNMLLGNQDELAAATCLTYVRSFIARKSNLPFHPKLAPLPERSPLTAPKCNFLACHSVARMATSGGLPPLFGSPILWFVFQTPLRTGGGWHFEKSHEPKKPQRILLQGKAQMCSRRLDTYSDWGLGSRH